ncbi:hypothetical protein EPR50_G00049720 [Perca flavescens]|uniref:Death domain-containing protein n=1 Tax=Perca flavescens TaxID=8167 RepID=A0A484DBY8_PERFV|nr:hypothetical protein EPR50_G00049720 [Perca flavescens]
MERRALALREMIKKHRPKTENLDPRKWMRQETVRGFADFILNKDSDKETDNSFDNKEMLLDAEKQFMEAAKSNDVETMKTLGKGLNINAKNVDNRTALHYAVAGKNKEAVQLLLQRRVKVDQKDKYGVAPIHLAAWFGSLEILKLLVQAGAEQKVENTRGETPLHLAARNGHLDAVQSLLQSFDTQDEVNMDGETALYQAADNGQEACVLTLLEAGCDPNILTTHLEAPIHLAVKNSHIPVIHSLLKAGCNINVTDKRSQTAIHLAAELARIDVVEMLLKSGLDLTLRDRQGKTALGVAVRADEVIIVDMIIKAERYYAWRKANTEPNESVHSEYALTFKLDHRYENKQLRSMAWRLAYELLKPGDWKRLAEHWGFTKEQVSAIEEQWTGQHSYQEHGNRMLLIWLHGEELAQKSLAKELYEGLILTGNRKAADKIRMEAESSSSKSCSIS